MKRKTFLLLAVLLCSIGLQATAFPSRTDFRDESIYFVMTTRFYNGDPSNDTQCWDAQQYNVGDPAWRGDFKGLIKQMDYIKALGFTAIWITPIVTNGSGYDYHGYHAMNFSEVDKRYESEDVLFQDVIDAAHARGMKIILDIVLNHTGNFGEEKLCKLFTRDWDADQSQIDECMVPYTQKDGGKLPDDYLSLAGGLQYAARLAQMKNTDGKNNDKNNYWHHFGSFNWDDDTRWWAQIAGDCVDLNTENQYVANYLVRCYGEFIKMGVDGFRIDTSGHISRLTFNKNFIPQFEALAEEYKAKRNGGDFFMFGEVCARDRNVTYRNRDNLSPYFYTWKETKDYAWDTSETSWNGQFVPEGSKGTHTNVTSVDQQAADYVGEHSDSRTSTNAFLNGNAYHTPDYSQASGFSVIDFPMHWNFRSAQEAWSVKSGDKYYNDATWNVVYVDSHDYAPDGAPEGQRFSLDQATWAENLALMFTFRGIPCIYYGSEIEFKKGCVIDKGPNIALRETGRAYFGGYLSGYVTTSDFGEYEEACGNMAQTLQHPLARHIRRLSKIRMAVPALRKGQYSTEGCSGSFAFKRRYTDATTDSYALVCISGNGTFTGVENGTYVDCVTGDTKTVTNGTLNASCSGKGNMRVYVLSTKLTPAPGKIGTDGNYLYGSSKANIGAPQWDGKEETLDPRFGGSGGSTGGDSGETPATPCLETADERCVFFQAPSGWGKSANVYMWIKDTNTNLVGAWPGKAATALGGGVFKFNIPADVTGDETQWMIIWNGSNGQTKDLAFTMRGLYTGDNKDNVSCTSTVTTLCADVPQPEEPAEPEPEPDPTPDYPEEEPCTGALPDPEPHSGEHSGNDQPQGIHEAESSLLLYTEQGTLYIGSETAQHVCIYAVDGSMVHALDLQAGITTINLPQGFYMVNNQKVILW
ncbi:MAG: alpha-amylase family glycosyl hydrolase [Bacteroidales bacterium]|nr:alpha-amylase family glycosyl hydrolase [Bacteroidales bacterium]